MQVLCFLLQNKANTSISSFPLVQLKFLGFFFFWVLNSKLLCLEAGNNCLGDFGSYASDLLAHCIRNIVLHTSVCTEFGLLSPSSHCCLDNLPKLTEIQGRWILSVWHFMNNVPWLWRLELESSCARIRSSTADSFEHLSPQICWRCWRLPGLLEQPLAWRDLVIHSILSILLSTPAEWPCGADVPGATQLEPKTAHDSPSAGLRRCPEICFSGEDFSKVSSKNLP